MERSLTGSSYPVVRSTTNSHDWINSPPLEQLHRRQTKYQLDHLWWTRDALAITWTSLQWQGIDCRIIRQTRDRRSLCWIIQSCRKTYYWLMNASSTGTVKNIVETETRNQPGPSKRKRPKSKSNLTILTKLNWQNPSTFLLLSVRDPNVLTGKTY